MERIRANGLLCLILIYLGMIFGCSHGKDSYADSVVGMLEKEIELINYSHIVIIPELGCGGCISEAENFFRENKDKNIYFIFTKISSMKELRLRLGQMINQKNVHIDIQQLYASEKEEMNVYPIVIDLRHDVKTWYFLEPGVSYRNLLND